jgi:hypothetical protein
VGERWSYAVGCGGVVLGGKEDGPSCDCASLGGKEEFRYSENCPWSSSPKFSNTNSSICSLKFPA